MKHRSAAFLAVLLLGSSLVIADANAARVGGGRDVGRQNNTIQRDAAPRQAPQQQGVPAQQQAPSQAAPARQAAPAAAPAAAAQPARNRWLGPVAGLAAGLGLAALASHLGFGEELASFMLIALLVIAALVVVRLIMARRAGAAGPRPAMAAPGYGNTQIGPEAAGSYPSGAMRSADAGFGGAAATAAPAAALASGLPPGVPADFDIEGFLRGARQQFVRLQAAFDAADVNQLREFVADELYPELQQQIAERGAASQRTDVVRLDAELLSIQQQGLDYMASVRFHGMIRESEGGAAEAFDEVWNLVRPTAGGSGWMLAGIQQLH
jgi:predicted lipid-binding transport protein (Tim44 family)